MGYLSGVNQRAPHYYRAESRVGGASLSSQTSRLIDKLGGVCQEYDHLWESSQESDHLWESDLCQKSDHLWKSDLSQKSDHLWESDLWLSYHLRQHCWYIPSEKIGQNF